MELTWLLRVVAAAASLFIYQKLFAPDWRNPALALYDLPVIALAASFGVGAIVQIVQREALSGAVSLGALAAALLIGYGAGYRAWPVSGHLTVALTTGLLEARNSANPPAYRVASLLPALALIAIRTWWPQSALMGNRFNTLTGCAAGATLAGLVSLLIRRS